MERSNRVNYILRLKDKGSIVYFVDDVNYAKSVKMIKLHGKYEDMDEAYRECAKLNKAS